MNEGGSSSYVITSGGTINEKKSDLYKKIFLLKMNIKKKNLFLRTIEKINNEEVITSSIEFINEFIEKEINITTYFSFLVFLVPK